MESAELIRIMEENIIPKHGVVDLKKVERILRERKVEIAETLLTFCGDNETGPYFSYCSLHLLFSLAQRGELSENQAEKLLHLAANERRFDIYADAECHKAIDYLGYGQQKYANVLVKFLEKLFYEKKVYDWRWIGYAIVSSLVGGRITFQMSSELAYRVIQEAENEENPRRRDQLIFLSGRLAENQKLYLN